MLVILDCNPVLTAPADLEFSKLMDQVSLRIRLGLYEDETSERCHWHIPETHYLESWGDARAFDGTTTILQPLIHPLYKGKSAYELLSAFAGEPARTADGILRDYWKGRMGADFEVAWKRSLRDGIVPGTESAIQQSISLLPNFNIPEPPTPPSQHSIEVVLRPDPTIGDGSMANNAWLQEPPKPITTLTWDNAALLSPSTAERLNLTNEDVVEIRHMNRALLAPVWILPGDAEDSITIHFGYGRTRAGSVGNGHGCNVYSIQTTDTRFIITGATVRKTSQRSPLASTQSHHAMEGRDVVRSLAVAARDRALPQDAKDRHTPHASLGDRCCFCLSRVGHCAFPARLMFMTLSSYGLRFEIAIARFTGGPAVFS